MYEAWKFVKEQKQGWGYGSEAEYLLGMYKAVNLILNTTKNQPIFCQNLAIPLKKILGVRAGQRQGPTI